MHGLGHWRTVLDLLRLSYSWLLTPATRFSETKLLFAEGSWSGNAEDSSTLAMKN